MKINLSFKSNEFLYLSDLPVCKTFYWCVHGVGWGQNWLVFIETWTAWKHWQRTSRFTRKRRVNNSMLATISILVKLKCTNHKIISSHYVPWWIHLWNIVFLCFFNVPLYKQLQQYCPMLTRLFIFLQPCWKSIVNDC